MSGSSPIVGSLPTPVDAQVTDAITQTNVKLVGEGPAESLSVETQAMAQAMALAMQNATLTQGGMQQIANSATAAMITLITQAM